MGKERPEILSGATHRARTEYGNFFVTINTLDGEPFEVIPRLGKPGNMVRTLLEHIGILYSIILRSDLSKDRIVEIFERHCRGVRDDNPFVYKGDEYLSCIDYMGRLVLEGLKKDEAIQKES